MLKRSCLPLMLLLLVAISEPASARSLPIVEWTSAATGCPRPADLLTRIGQLIGVGPEKLVGRLVRLDADVVHAAPESWQMRLTLKTAGGGGERRFVADSCRQLVDAAVLIVALAIDPDAVKRQKQKKRPAAKKRPAKDNPPRSLQLALRPEVSASFGVLPSASAGFGVAAALLWRSLRIELGLAHELAQQKNVDGHATAAGDLQLLLRGALRGCYRLTFSDRLDVDLCGGGEAGWLHGAGRNIETPDSGDTLWISLVTSAGVSYRIWRRFWARLDGHFGFSPTRPRFEIEGIGEVHRPSAVMGRFGFGLEARFL